MIRGLLRYTHHLTGAIFISFLIGMLAELAKVVVPALITDFVSEYARQIVKIATSDQSPIMPNWHNLDGTK